MKVNVGNNVVVDVRVQYVYHDNGKPVETHVDVYDMEGVLLGHGNSKCHPNDRCEKLLGRKYALMHLFQEFNGNFTKEQRRAVWEVVCPKYFQGGNRNANVEKNKPGLMRRLFNLGRG